MDPRFCLETYLYDYPSELVARVPSARREDARMMVVDKKRGQIDHCWVKNLPQYFGKNDVLVANNTKVLPARFLGFRSDLGERTGKVEFLALRQIEPELWEGILHCASRQRPGLQFEIDPLVKNHPVLRATVVEGADRSEGGVVRVHFSEAPFDQNGNSFWGRTPLPPYIRDDICAGESRWGEETDFKKRYQTVYSKVPGSAAAPTAGLHFTDPMIQELESQGTRWETLTLHVGVGTFRPVNEKDIRKHSMHKEWYRIDPKLAETLGKDRINGKSISAVGTTSLRALESAWVGDRFESGFRETDLYFYPGGKDQLRVVQKLCTNFHLPGSSLFILICSILGVDFARQAYREAIHQKYRLFSFGDLMLIL